MRLTANQKAMMARLPITNSAGERFIPLTTKGEDRTAKSLEAKGLGTFIDNGWRYSWRKRDGYTNTFYFRKVDK